MRAWFALLVVGLLLATVAPVARVSTLGTSPVLAGARPAGLPTGNATLVIRVTPTAASVEVNGTSVPLASNGSAAVPLAPGVYAVTVEASGFRPFVGNVTLGPGEVKFVVVTLPSEPGSNSGIAVPPASFLVAILATAVGVAAIVVLYLFLRRAPKETPPAPPPDPAAEPAADPGPDPDEGPP